MKRLHPPPGVDLALEDVHGGLGDRGPWVALGMVASVDGAATDADGRSGSLGSEGDLASFRALRAAADVILVGAGTARTERYGPVRLSQGQRRARQQRGQTEVPALAVLTRSLDLHDASRLFQDGQRPWVFAPDRGGSRARLEKMADLAERGADVTLLGGDELDLVQVVDELASRGCSRILCEGGPRLNADLLAAGVVTRVHLTVAPTLLAGDAGRIVVGDAPRQQLRLESVHEHDGDLVVAWTVHSASG